MSLRDELIEAGALAIKNRWLANTRGPTPGPLSRGDSTAALDAFLDKLAERADEWERLAYDTISTVDRDVFGSAAIAVLRDGAETKGEGT